MKTLRTVIILAWLFSMVAAYAQTDFVFTTPENSSKINQFISNSLKFKNEGDLDQALNLLEQALEIAEEKMSNMFIAYCQDEIAGIYLIQGEYETALDHAFRGLNYNRKINSKWGECNSLNIIAEGFMKLGNQRKALDFAMKENEIAHKEGLKEVLVINYGMLSEIYVRMDDYKSAFENYVIYNDLKDSLRMVEKRGLYYYLEGRKSYEQGLLNMKVEARMEELDSLEATWTWTISASIGLSMLMLFVLIMVLRKQRKHPTSS
ncbi:MAG: tetratricopeptide repeat protein [Bacteroidetes bacterium]|nr:tetratricopeptide repeat protein [Bacteroidota bacterium]